MTMATMLKISDEREDKLKAILRKSNRLVLYHGTVPVLCRKLTESLFKAFNMTYYVTNDTKSRVKNVLHYNIGRGGDSDNISRKENALYEFLVPDMITEMYNVNKKDDIDVLARAKPFYYIHQKMIEIGDIYSGYKSLDYHSEICIHMDSRSWYHTTHIITNMSTNDSLGMEKIKKILTDDHMCDVIILSISNMEINNIVKTWGDEFKDRVVAVYGTGANGLADVLSYRMFDKQYNTIKEILTIAQSKKHISLNTQMGKAIINATHKSKTSPHDYEAVMYDIFELAFNNINIEERLDYKLENRRRHDILFERINDMGIAKIRQSRMDKYITPYLKAYESSTVNNFPNITHNKHMDKLMENVLRHSSIGLSKILVIPEIYIHDDFIYWNTVFRDLGYDILILTNTLSHDNLTIVTTKDGNKNTGVYKSDYYHLGIDKLLFVMMFGDIEGSCDAHVLKELELYGNINTLVHYDKEDKMVKFKKFTSLSYTRHEDKAVGMDRWYIYKVVYGSSFGHRNLVVNFKINKGEVCNE